MLKYDCKYFSGDRPCNFHKEFKIKCDYCDNYDPIKFKILIIKLDAIGDVLRTTSILQPLKLKYPNSHVTWCTKGNAKDLFIQNGYVDEVITIEEDAQYRLSAEEFDIAINLDSSKKSSAIAAMVKSKDKKGFALDKKGSVIPQSPEADHWLLMSAFDDIKKENQRSYQEIIYEILGLDSGIALPVLNIPEVVTKKISSIAENWNLIKNKQTIGLNIGVGTKWSSKGWPLERWEELIEYLQKKPYNLMLLGGLEEKEKMDHLAGKYKSVIDTGCNNSIMEFAAIVKFCDILITADTFALHVGTALNKRIVALFGPTSDSEIYLYNKGIKITTLKDCKCYYRPQCTEPVSCMSEIKITNVVKAIDLLNG